MLNFLWAGMILIGIIYGTLTGNMERITDAVLDSAGEGISLAITMAGVVAFWMGMMEIAAECGLVRQLTVKIMPVLRFIFPKIPPDHRALEYISSNVIANILGLGWAGTPAGLKAMEALAELEGERGNATYIKDGGVRVAGNEMCNFLILNISSLQLIPINIIAYRSQYGSAQPAAIIGPGLAATAVSTLTAVIFCKVANKKKQKYTFENQFTT